MLYTIAIKETSNRFKIMKSFLIFLFVNPSIEEIIYEEKTLSILELITSTGMGGSIILITLSILSIIAVYIFIERYYTIKNVLSEDPTFLKEIKELIIKKDIEGAKDKCNKIDSPISRIFKQGIIKDNKSLSEISAYMESQSNLEIYQLEKNLSSLATISGAAPMIGFLGTVIGMILAFHEMASSGGNINVEMLSKGIYTAMVTTVAGLIVGIIAYIAYNILVTKVDNVIFTIEKNTNKLINILFDKK
tara:strand:+ start:282 stop:1025 length:744 start_codon:yes stop_codon:yes gene_type:complete